MVYRPVSLLGAARARPPGAPSGPPPAGPLARCSAAPRREEPATALPRMVIIGAETPFLTPLLARAHIPPRPARSSPDRPPQVPLEVGPLEIRSGRMVHLGYGKYWSADGIRGLVPVEEDRGPGRRTKVFVEGRSDPIVASRTEEAILDDMEAEGRESRARELRDAASDLLERLRGLSPVLRRMLRTEGGLDLEHWIRRLESATGDRSGGDPEGDVDDESQEDLFPGL